MSILHRKAAKVMQPFFRSVSPDHLFRVSHSWPQNAEHEGDALERYKEFMTDYGLLDGHRLPIK